MGNQTSSGNKGESSPGHHRGRVLPPNEHEAFQKLWTSLVDEDPAADRITSERFEAKYSETPNIAKSIFIYLSLNNPSIEKEFFENRLVDLIGHHSTPHSFVTAPWETLVDAVGLTPQSVLQICLRSEANSVQAEPSTGQELKTVFPAIAEIFNRSVVDFVLHHENWSLSRTTENGLLTALHQNMLHVIKPNLDFSDINLLFSMALHGASFRALASSIKHYPGELLVLVLDVSDRVFGFYSNRSAWTETISEGRAFDELARDSVLFQLSPQLRVRRVNQRGSSNCIYFNMNNANHVQGLGLGGKESSFRLWLDGADISSISSMAVDATFQVGQLLACDPAEEALVETKALNIEIYGLGGSGALDEQQERKSVEEDVRTDRRKVDRVKLVQNEFNRDMFFGKTFKQGAAAEERLGT